MYKSPNHIQHFAEAPTHFQPAKAKPEYASRSNFFDKYALFIIPIIDI